MTCRTSLLFALLTAAVLPVSGRTRTPVVRVAFPPSHAWARIEQDGTRKGIVPEWTEELAKRSGWEVRWVHTVWEKAFDQLEKGDVDLVVGAAYSKSRAARLLFPSTPFLLYPSYLFVRRDFRTNGLGLKSLTGKRIGFVRGFLHNGVLQDYLNRKLVPNWKPVFYRTATELDQALAAGKVDAALGDVVKSLGRGQAVPLIALPPIPLFTVVSPRRPDLLSGIEYATSDMMLNSGNEIREMHLRNLPPPTSDLPLIDTTNDPDLGRALVAVSRNFRMDNEDEMESFVPSNSNVERVLAIVVASLSVLGVFVLLAFLRLYRHGQAGVRARTNFLSLMSHEIRTPLNAVVGFAETLRRPGLSPREIAACAKGVDDSAQALLSMLNDLLDLSRLQDPYEEVTNGVCDCARVFAAIQGMFAARFTEKGVSFTCRTDVVPRLYLRESCLNQILVNLVGTAFRLTSSGAVTCTAAAATEDADHVTFLLVIRDTGSGISPETLQVILDPFTQANTMRRDTFTEGAGPGLAVVNRLVKAAGGSLEVRSSFGQGTTSVVRIPGLKICREEDPADTASSPGRVAMDLPRSVLVVDDMPLNLKILQLHLAGLGVTDVRTAADGVEALAALERERVDLVLSDVWMPVMDGAQLAREIVRRWPGLPVVAVTADTDASSSFDLSAFHAILTKPITVDMLRRAMADCGFTAKGKADGDGPHA